MSENQPYQKEITSKINNSLNVDNSTDLVDTTAHTDKTIQQHDVVIGFIVSLAFFAIFYVGCSWIRKQIDKLIEVKGVRLVLTAIVLPLVATFVSEQFVDDNKKFIYLLVLIISILTSERSTTLTVDKKCREKDDEISETQAEVEHLNRVILDKISEFKNVHLARLLRISDNQELLTADEVRKEVRDYTNFMLFQSTFLHTVDELRYKANTDIPRANGKALENYNSVMK
ncbi:hypothetical protein [Cronobacter malonaticus]|uniref:hypothetical protein n=1 Tax=Cronobacter malonaticus TaxID=413503 RepID=UPI000948A1F6|nr:hypothetical protein [Cronobacter malonaticus]PUX15718.1 hypothetical protein BS413_18015 [Cronobacter malonaticus]